jgi:hypothetical protein
LSDYAVVLIGAVFIFSSASWVFSARKWFKGPVSNVTEEYMVAVEHKGEIEKI